jgi:release factor glutamine methyltransferase
VTTVAGALAEARARGVASLDAQLLLARVRAVTRSALIAGAEHELSRAEEQRWRVWRDRRAAGEPLAYLLGEKEFHGLLLEVTPDVLVPRPETELLVEWASSLLAPVVAARTGRGDAAPRVVDLGTGSGAIALALKRLCPEAEIVATDASAAALAVARRNADRHGLAIELLGGPWWIAVAGGPPFDIAVANPPYVAAGDPHLEELRHEPIVALSPGADGLDALRAIVAGAAAHLAPGGWLVVEHGFDQGAAVRALFSAADFAAIETRRDLAGHERATAGRRTATV